MRIFFTNALLILAIKARKMLQKYLVWRSAIVFKAQNIVYT